MLSGTLCAFGPTVLWSDPEIPCAFVVLGLPTLCYPGVRTPCFPSLVRSDGTLLDPVFSSYSVSCSLPSTSATPTCSRFFRFRKQGAIGNPCTRTTCFVSPRSSLVAPPKRLPPVRPVSRLDSTKGRVSNDLVPRHPTPSSRQTPFQHFPGGSQYRSPLLLRDHGAGCTNTPHHTPHDFSFFLTCLRSVFTEYTYIRAMRHSPLVSPQTPHVCDLSYISLLCQRTLTSA